MKECKKLKTEYDIFSNIVELKNKVIVDVGCGEGKLTKEISKVCKYIYGLDLEEVILKIESSNIENIKFLYGLGQNIPLETNSVDIIIFFKSFHHIPKENMEHSIKEIKRILKKNGTVCFVEPLPILNSYYEFSRLVNDEEEILKFSYKVIKSLENEGFQIIDESFYSITKQYMDFENQVNLNVKQETKKQLIFEKAKKLIEQKNETLENIKIISYLRMNVFKMVFND